MGGTFSGSAMTPPKPAPPKVVQVLGTVTVSGGDDAVRWYVNVADSPDGPYRRVGYAHGPGDVAVVTGLPYNETRWLTVQVGSVQSDPVPVTAKPLIDTAVINRIVNGTDARPGYWRRLGRAIIGR